MWHGWFLLLDTLGVFSVCLKRCSYNFFFTELLHEFLHERLHELFLHWSAVPCCSQNHYTLHLLHLSDVIFSPCYLSIMVLCSSVAEFLCWWVLYSLGVSSVECVSRLLPFHANALLCRNHLSKHLLSRKACVSLHYIVILFINTSFYIE